MEMTCKKCKKPVNSLDHKCREWKPLTAAEEIGEIVFDSKPTFIADMNPEHVQHIQIEKQSHDYLTEHHVNLHPNHCNDGLVINGWNHGFNDPISAQTSDYSCDISFDSVS